jgi:hypothetical protein
MTCIGSQCHRKKKCIWWTFGYRQLYLASVFPARRDITSVLNLKFIVKVTEILTFDLLSDKMVISIQPLSEQCLKRNHVSASVAINWGKVTGHQ